MENAWNVFIHNLFVRRFSMAKFRWQELKNDILLAGEVTFSRPSTLLKKRLGDEHGSHGESAGDKRVENARSYFSHAYTHLAT